ncbi:MAG: C2H2-type zinc finger protein [Deinococcus sp.]|nr:C2H2-type zinc finger protein [Deinococcus sp.]
MAQSFRCTACGGEFPTQKSLEEHGRQAHQGQQKSGFRCAACGGEFPTRERLEEHGRQAHRP